MKRIYKNRLLSLLATKFMIVIDVFVFLSTLLGGYLLIFKNGGGLPIASLADSPFTSFFWPGLILTLIVGGTHLLAAILLIKKNRYWMEGSSVAGFGILIWIFTEVYMTKGPHFLQIVYFVAGITNLTFTIFLQEGKRN